MKEGNKVADANGNIAELASETLKNAADAGAIKIIIDPSATWEHIDFNMFMP